MKRIDNHFRLYWYLPPTETLQRTIFTDKAIIYFEKR
jgi:hypothetical protein